MVERDARRLRGLLELHLGQQPRQGVAQHLAAGGEAAPQQGIGAAGQGWFQALIGGKRIQADQLGIHLRRRGEAAGRHRTHRGAAGQQLHPHAQGRIGAAAGPGADALTHLLLHQQHQGAVGPLQGPIQPAHQPLQQGTGDVVRDVGHHLLGSGPRRRLQGQGQDVALQ